MDFTPATVSRVFQTSSLINELKQGCLWANLERGRATLYAKLIGEYFAGTGTSREHVLAYHDAMEIAEIYKLWAGRVDKFPGLKEKIAEAFTSGPTIQDDETPSNGGPRNYAFNYFVAGRLLAAGCDVISVDGISRTGELGTWFGDVTLRHADLLLDIQCKRPYFAENVLRNVDRAEKQILTASPGVGVIAIDASVFIRPQGTLWPASSDRAASEKLSDLIQPHAEYMGVRMKTPEIAGLLWFGRLPSAVSQPSRLFKPTGGRYELPPKLYSAHEIAACLNPSSTMAHALYQVTDRLKIWMQTKWN